MNALPGVVFVPTTNAPGKKDVTGAFLPEAVAFMKAHAIPGVPRRFDNTAAMAERALEVGQALERLEGVGLGSVTFFCHGWKDGIQAGWRTAGALGLARRIAKASRPDVVVTLYACDAGRDADADRADDRQAGPGGQGGFADVLHAALVSEGVRQATVWAHSTEGHTTMNPWVRVWREGERGLWAVEPHSQHWAVWRRLLSTTGFRLRFPFLTREGLEAALGQFH